METTPPSIFSKALVIGAISLGIGLAFNYLFYGELPGINFPIFTALISVGLFIISKFYRQPLDAKTHWLFIPIAFFSLMVFVRSSPLLTFMNIGASLLLLLLLARLSFARTLKSLILNDYIKTIFLPLSFLRPFAKVVGDLISLRGINKNSQVTSQIWKGIIMTIPVLVIFILLFSSADLVFNKYLLDIINIQISAETVVRTILVSLVTAGFMGAYTYFFNKSGEEIVVTTSTHSKVGHIETSILLGSINLLFLVFIIVQLTYLFGGQTTVANEGFTYASYAHRGFFELIAVAVISFFMLLTTEKYIVKKDGAHSGLFKLLSTALIIQIIVIMASAFTRLSLYENAYGFTTLRLYSHAFIVFLGAIFCILLYKIYLDSRENMLAFRIFIAVIAFVAGMNIANPDAFIAQHNINRFIETGKLDANYIGQMSSDALPVSIQILKMPASAERNALAYELYWQADTDARIFSTQWQSLNISRRNARKLINEHMAELKEHQKYEMPTAQIIED